MQLTAIPTSHHSGRGGSGPSALSLELLDDCLGFTICQHVSFQAEIVVESTARWQYLLLVPVATSHLSVGQSLGPVRGAAVGVHVALASHLTASWSRLLSTYVILGHSLLD